MAGAVLDDDRRMTDGETPETPLEGHFVYVLECGDGSLYTGYTTDVQRRLEEHRNGVGAKYTHGRTPIELVHVEGFENRSAAQSREAEIKALSRRQKESLVLD